MLSLTNQQLSLQLTQLKPPFYINKITSQSLSPIKSHIHLTHFYQMILVRNILNLYTTTIKTHPYMKPMFHVQSTINNNNPTPPSSEHEKFVEELKEAHEPSALLALHLA